MLSINFGVLLAGKNVTIVLNESVIKFLGDLLTATNWR